MSRPAAPGGRWALVPAVVLLAGPAVVAFFTGGFPDEPRQWAGLVAWLLAATGLALTGVPAGRPARVALAGALAFAAWTLLSTLWAPVTGPAWDAGQVAALYAGALVAAATLLGAPRAAALAEPALALGTLVVVGYGLGDRLLPGLLEYSRSLSAEGRLEQPLTYWNGMGAVAALGVVLTARLAGDVRRTVALRCAAAAAGVPLALGLALSVSRGALWACVAGLLALVIAGRRRELLHATLVVCAAGLAAALVAQPFAGVTRLEGDAAARSTAGLVVLVGVLVLAAGAALAVYALAVRGRPGPLTPPRWAAPAAAVLVVGGFVLALAVGTDETRAGRSGLDPGADRLTRLDSNRYEYWKVAGRAFADAPVAGVGAGGWAVRWLRERPFREGASDAHSLVFQTAAELGLVGLALLAAWLAGLVAAGRAALRVDRAAAAGPVGGLVLAAAHNALDWDFELPATTLPVMVLAGLLLVVAGREARR